MSRVQAYRLPATAGVLDRATLAAWKAWDRSRRRLVGAAFLAGAAVALVLTTAFGGPSWALAGAGALAGGGAFGWRAAAAHTPRRSAPPPPPPSTRLAPTVFFGLASGVLGFGLAAIAAIPLRVLLLVTLAGRPWMAAILFVVAVAAGALLRRRRIREARRFP